MYKDFYIDFWKGDQWGDTVLNKFGHEVEELVNGCLARDESVRVRRMDVETEQLCTTYCHVSDGDRKSYTEWNTAAQKKRFANRKKTIPSKPLTDEQVQKMLDRLANHFGCPVRPVNQYCEALREWAYQISIINQEAEKVAKAAGTESTRHGCEYHEHLRHIMMDIRKSNLLFRLIYAGEELRTEQCPIHKGKWSGCSFEGCIYGCGETGWLPK
ncbi:MAG: hypothetical protein ACXADB_03070 [Candidatus Hermodarchaeia archaeon]|jgi:hypothetical protein